ncbi:uncharacterized protein [Rutidosis leptorrhynchoides]|uniref:uncharacterized protein n=1 Tax=Rutidosis leptorrhynchoides TaxID=125765 RepID=UPI003A9A1E6C
MAPSHYYSSTSDCYDILKTLLPKGFSLNTTNYHLIGSSTNITYEAANFLVQLCGKVDGIEAADKYSRPMVWIGLYIAAASLYCTAAMAADFLHGVHNENLWLPCNYFSVNAASITMISVAMKLTLDMTTRMPGIYDQEAKLLSLAFMCTIMANSMPSLASMSSKSLVANVIGLIILVITIIVNLCIEITTGIISHDYTMTYILILTMMLCLLILTISSAITIPTCKKILEFKYQAFKNSTLNNQHPQQNSLDQLRLYVTRYWVMIQTGNPQFVIAINPLSLASNIISIINIFILVACGLLYHYRSLSFGSDYKGSTFAIFATQLTGIAVGNSALFVRFLLLTSISNIVMDFKVEKYWTQKLHEWKEHQILILSDQRSLTEFTLKNFSISMNRLIRNAEKEQHNNFLTLLENPNGYRGVENFDTDQVQPLLSIELSNNWSLPLVTLSCIAISLPNIHKGISNTLFKSVGEGLYYTCLVEESLNSASEYGNIHKAAINLWQEVEDDCKWLANSLKRSAYYGKTPVEILKQFADKAKDIVMDITRNTDDTEQVENFPIKLIAANSMYRIARTILIKHDREPIREEELFKLLYGMIGDIMFACFSNIPQVIKMKCNESVIEKRVASVEVAAKLLGRSTEIIKRLEALDLPNMDPDKMAFIDEWRLHLKQSIP